MGNLLLDLVAGGHLVGLVLICIAAAILIYQWRVIGLNGLTLALILFLLASAFEKSWSVTRVYIEHIAPQINTINPVTTWDYLLLGWRTLAVWLMVAALIYLFYAAFIVYSKGEDGEDAQKTETKTN